MVEPTVADLAAVSRQLGRPPRGVARIAHRCACGLPDVVATEPRLPDGTPFPTTFYLTCPRATAALSTLESERLMVDYELRVAPGGDWQEEYAAAHEDYLRRRADLGDVAEVREVSAGGMPSRVKCLHALAAHSLAAGPGVNPVGDEALATLDAREMWSTRPPCAPARIAAVDCGTNSIRLLVVELDPFTGSVHELHRDLIIVRLGEGVDATGRLSDGALERTFAACEGYAEVLRELQVGAVRFVATSASRDASNREVFVTGVRDRLGVEPEVISGEEEARLSFLGATSSPAVRAGAEPRLVFDIGGGSTEFVLGGDDPVASVSVDVGCVRLAERWLASDPPAAAEVAGVRSDAREAIGRASATVPFGHAASLVGLAGTVTTVAALYLGLDEYDPVAIHGSRIPAAEVTRIAADLAAMTLAERLALPVMHPGRADVIVAGAAVLDEVLRAVGLAEVIVSEQDILDGIAIDLARRPAGRPADPTSGVDLGFTGA